MSKKLQRKSATILILLTTEYSIILKECCLHIPEDPTGEDGEYKWGDIITTIKPRFFVTFKPFSSDYNPVTGGAIFIRYNPVAHDFTGAASSAKESKAALRIIRRWAAQEFGAVQDW